MYKRFKNLKDFFEVKCLKCGSQRVVLYGEECEDCGSYVRAECEDCNAKFSEHNPGEMIEVEE